MTKTHTLQARIPGDLWDALKAEADRKGCSVSQVAWLWLEFARKLKPSEEIA